MERVRSSLARLLHSRWPKRDSIRVRIDGKGVIYKSASGLFESLADETGSLIILVLTLFLLLLISSLTVVDITDNFLAKRELIEIGEVAITRAAHQISLSRYYAGHILMDNSVADGSQFRIPLDCAAANRAFLDEISVSTLRGGVISVHSWSCSDDQVVATITATAPVLVKLPLGIGSSSNEVSSTIAATSIIGGARG